MTRNGTNPSLPSQKARDGSRLATGGVVCARRSGSMAGRPPEADPGVSPHPTAGPCAGCVAARGAADSRWSVPATLDGSPERGRAAGRRQGASGQFVDGTRRMVDAAVVPPAGRPPALAGASIVDASHSPEPITEARASPPAPAPAGSLQMPAAGWTLTFLFSYIECSTRRERAL